VTHKARALAPAPAQRVRVRWKIFGCLFAFGMVAYLQQRTLTVAGYQMMPQLGLSQEQLAWLEDAFLLGYTCLQFPGGVLGQRLGARRLFVLISCVAVLAMLVAPFAPLVFAGTALFVVLGAAQLLLGAAQGPIFPVSAGVFETWFTPQRWSLVQGLQSMGLQLGAAAAPPLIGMLMSAYGWQRAILWTTLPVLGLIVLWAWYGRNTPAEHGAVSAAELAELGGEPAARTDGSISWGRLLTLLKSRDVLALTVSYLCMNYVFYVVANWTFLYLVQERHFTVLEGGWLAAAPPVAAAIGAGVGGQLGSVLQGRLGVRRGLRLVPLLSLPAAGILLFAVVAAGNGYLAALALALCFACVELNEGPYWAAIMQVGRADTMAASGVLNTGGNLGGLIATPIVGYLSQRHAWTGICTLGAALAALSAVLWLLVDPERAAADG
jgi:sugar phosphate permease